ncbi:PREDICTED: pregnancy-specific beta-1-glycoprotein 6-like [Nanorana parkeri]|uniref:pregnancy-specific beta-1-glycoprotein 6-like n=1 Tax=Nanorana parkeri TaxID=125878 RepID=UPI00085466D6|nr:PREDICTED: pregnancy-specific beta-1-glycoprotein 6-like [Nanorana parkeri]
MPLYREAGPRPEMSDTRGEQITREGWRFVIAKMPSIWTAIIKSWVLGVTLSVCMNLASGIKIEVSPPNPKDGDTVILKVTEVSGAILFATWYKGRTTDASNQILNFFPPEQEFKGEKYFAEAHGQRNGSLVINKVRTDFNGYYTVQIQTKEQLHQSYVLLTVNGVMSIALSPFALLLGMLLFSDLNFI